jgi:hypothetical protein
LSTDRNNPFFEVLRPAMILAALHISALETLRHQLPFALQRFNLDLGPALQAWQEALDRKLLPRMSPDFPLIGAICGGGSAGKSTLFNSLVGEPISPTGGRAGLNRRVLVALQPRHLQSTEFVCALDQAFKETWQPMESTDQLTVAGHPLYWSGSKAPEAVVLLDTPDIDTGSAGRYANREAALESLEAADLLIYIFTNATYNNRDNTDFMAALLNTVGTRPCFLVYRVYPSFNDAEVREHASTVARNLYGPGFKDHVLGVFRADEDNAVAAGEQPIHLKAVDPPGSDLAAALAGLDTRTLRQKMLASVFSDSLEHAGQMIQRLHSENEDLKRYLELLTTVQQRCVQRALSHFPTDQVLGRFAEIWLVGDPAHIKWMRLTGRLVEWPYKAVFKVVRRLRGAAGQPASAPDEDRLNDQFELDLLEAANQLYQAALDTGILSNDLTVKAPAALQDARAHLREKNWQEVLGRIAEQKKMLLSWSDQLEGELEKLADDLRNRMGLFDQVRQTFGALLNVIPATAAVTYILHTGDPVGAAGIKVKLTGLFGLQDLYALIAIPVTSGMKRADRKQLERMLAPVAATWLAHKIKVVEALFTEHITGELLRQAESIQTETDEHLAQLSQALAACTEEE